MNIREPVLYTVAVGVLVGAVVVGIERGLNKEDAAPVLRYQKLGAGPNFIDVFVQNGSSRPVMVHGYVFQVVAIVRQPPPPPPNASRISARSRACAPTS